MMATSMHKEKEPVMVQEHSKMVISMKENGQMTRPLARVNFGTQVAMSTEASGKMIKLKELASIPLKMAQFI